MSFQPIVPFAGVTGWRFLERTEDAQRAAFARAPELDREIRYFKENIAAVTDARALVSDRSLLKVALGAFGLDEEIYKTAFLERILAEGTDDRQSLANRFVDPRYAEFSRAFGFGDLGGSRTADPGFGRRITEAHHTRQFEIAVGGSNADMRMALSFRREIAGHAGSGAGEGADWFRILGRPPLRAVFEAAYNLPAEFAGLDVDRQRTVLQDKTRAMFGDSSVSTFREPENIDSLINRFLGTRQAAAGPQGNTPGMTALSLLQEGGIGSSGLVGLILSNRVF